MNFDEKLCQLYQNLLSQKAEQMRDSLVKKCIRNLQKCKKDSNMCHSGDDSPLENLWDEICVQVQSEHSVYWELDTDYAAGEIHRLLETQCSPEDLKILWLQTKGFDAWYSRWCAEEVIQEAFHADGTPEEYNREDVMDWLLEVLLSAAGNYTNKRIEKSLF